jgi:hypothetical protein
MPLMRKKKLRKIRKIRIRRELFNEENDLLSISASLKDFGPGVRSVGLTPGPEVWVKRHGLTHGPGRDCWAA